MTETPPRIDNAPTWTGSLSRHFADLRDRNHAGDAVTREEKERHFLASSALVAPHAIDVLDELNATLLLRSGTVLTQGPIRTTDGGLDVRWILTWGAQVEAGVEPVQVIAFYGGGFHHPHLRGGTVGDWTFNVFNKEHATAQRSVLAAIAEAELHNLVFQADYRIVPATTAHKPRIGVSEPFLQ